MKINQILWLIGNFVVLILSVLWYIENKGFEPLIVGVTALISFVIQFYTSNSENIKMSIKSGKKSKNYQSKGDITIHNEE